MCYLYDTPEASFKDLVLATMQAEVESRDHNMTKVKAVTVMESNKDVETSGIGLSDLNEKLKALGQYLNSYG